MLLQPLPSSSYSASVGFYLDSSCDLLVPAALQLWPCLCHELTSCAHPEQLLSFIALPPSHPYAGNNTSVAELFTEILGLHGKLTLLLVGA